MHHVVPLRHQLGWWAHAILSMAKRGRHFSRDPHDQANYERLLKIAAEMRAVVDHTTPTEVERRIHERFGLGGPIPVADAAIFDSEGRILLIQRADNGLWAMPGGGLDVGETPAEGACREAWEETGLTVRARALVGVYDSRANSAVTWHLYAFVFLCEPVSGTLTLSHETLDVRWFDPDALPPLSGGHTHRIADAVAFYRAAQPVTHFE